MRQTRARSHRAINGGGNARRTHSATLALASAEIQKICPWHLLLSAHNFRVSLDVSHWERAYGGLFSRSARISMTIHWHFYGPHVCGGVPLPIHSIGGGRGREASSTRVARHRHTLDDCVVLYEPFVFKHFSLYRVVI